MPHLAKLLFAASTNNSRNFDMKAPDKIYLHGYDFDDEPCKNWEIEPKVKGMRGYPAKHAEYIRKDLLLEWAKERMKLYDPIRTDAGRELQMIIYKFE